MWTYILVMFQSFTTNQLQSQSNTYICLLEDMEDMDRYKCFELRSIVV